MRHEVLAKIRKHDSIHLPQRKQSVCMCERERERGREREREKRERERERERRQTESLWIKSRSIITYMCMKKKKAAVTHQFGMILGPNTDYFSVTKNSGLLHQTAMLPTLLPNPIEGIFWKACLSLERKQFQNILFALNSHNIMALRKRTENKPSN